MDSFVDLITWLGVLVVTLPVAVQGHGRMLEPASRMSAYLKLFPTPTNHEDHQMNCGGLTVQWTQNGGRCGICGDSWSGPRDYERPDGRMVQHQVFTQTYKENESIRVVIQITVNHKGWFEFRLCDISTSGGVEATHACLDRNLLADDRGRTRFDSPPDSSGTFEYVLVLPSGLTCSHCVLQWKWKCGNNYGCDDGGCGVGRGETQEEFYACSDVKIEPRSGSSPIIDTPSRPIQPGPNPSSPIDISSRPNPETQRRPNQPSDTDISRRPNPVSQAQPNPPSPVDISRRPNPETQPIPNPPSEARPYPPRPGQLPVQPRPAAPEQPEGVSGIPEGFSTYREYLQDMFSSSINEALKYENKVRAPMARRRAASPNTEAFDRVFLRDVVGYPAPSQRRASFYSNAQRRRWGGLPSWMQGNDGYHRDDALDRLCAACTDSCLFSVCHNKCPRQC